MDRGEYGVRPGDDVKSTGDCGSQPNLSRSVPMVSVPL